MKYTLDLQKLLCPMPVIKVQDKIKQLKTGDLLSVMCTDPGVLEDIPTWCRMNNHVVCNIKKDGYLIIIEIQVN